jgi:hypothetical protein
VTTSLTCGSRVHADQAQQVGLPGTWSVWSQAADSPGAYFLVPVDDDARTVGIKYAVIRAVMGRTANRPALSLIRTDPPRNDLVEADLERRNRMKEKRA